MSYNKVVAGARNTRFLRLVERRIPLCKLLRTSYGSGALNTERPMPIIFVLIDITVKRCGVNLPEGRRESKMRKRTFMGPFRQLTGQRDLQFH